MEDQGVVNNLWSQVAILLQTQADPNRLDQEQLDQVDLQDIFREIFRDEEVIKQLQSKIIDNQMTEIQLSSNMSENDFEQFIQIIMEQRQQMDPQLQFIYQFALVFQRLQKQGANRQQLLQIRKQKLRQVKNLLFRGQGVQTQDNLRQAAQLLQGIYENDFFVYNISQEGVYPIFVVYSLQNIADLSQQEQFTNLQFDEFASQYNRALPQNLVQSQLRIAYNDVLAQLIQDVQSSVAQSFDITLKKVDQKFKALEEEYTNNKGFILDFYALFKSSQQFQQARIKQEMMEFRSINDRRIQMQKTQQINKEKFDNLRQQLLQQWQEFQVQNDLENRNNAIITGVLTQLLRNSEVLSDQMDVKQFQAVKQNVQQQIGNLYYFATNQRATQEQLDEVVYNMFSQYNRDVRMIDVEQYTDVDRLIQDSGYRTMAYVEDSYSQLVGQLNNFQGVQHLLSNSQQLQIEQFRNDAERLRKQYRDQYNNLVKAYEQQMNAVQKQKDLLKMGIYLTDIDQQLIQMRNSVKQLFKSILEQPSNIDDDDKGDDDDDDDRGTGGLRKKTREPILKKKIKVRPFTKKYAQDETITTEKGKKLSSRDQKLLLETERLQQTNNMLRLKNEQQQQEIERLRKQLNDQGDINDQMTQQLRLNLQQLQNDMNKRQNTITQNEDLIEQNQFLRQQIRDQKQEFDSIINGLNQRLRNAQNEASRNLTNQEGVDQAYQRLQQDQNRYIDLLQQMINQQQKILSSVSIQYDRNVYSSMQDLITQLDRLQQQTQQTIQKQDLQIMGQKQQIDKQEQRNIELEKLSQEQKIRITDLTKAVIIAEQQVDKLKDQRKQTHQWLAQRKKYLWTVEQEFGIDRLLDDLDRENIDINIYEQRVLETLQFAQKSTLREHEDQMRRRQIGFEDQMNQKQQEITDLQQQIQQLQNNQSNLSQNERQQAEQQIFQLQSTLQAMQQEQQELQRQNLLLNNQIAQQSQRMLDYEQQIQIDQANINERTQQNQQIQYQLNEQNRQREELEQNMREHVDQYRQLQNEAKGLEQQIEDLKKQGQYNEDTIKQDLQQTREALTEIQNRYQDTEERNGQLYIDKENLERELEGQRIQLEVEGEEKKQLAEENQQLQDQINLATADVEELKKENEQLVELWQREQNRRREEQNAVQQREQQIRQLRADMDSLKSDRDQERLEIQQKIGQLEQQNDTIRQQMKEKEEERSKLYLKVQEQGMQIAHLDSEIVKLKNQFKGKQKEINEKQDELNYMNEEIERNKERIDKLQQQEKEYQVKINQLEEQQNKLKQENQVQDQQIQRLQQTVEQNERAIKQLNNQISRSEQTLSSLQKQKDADDQINQVQIEKSQKNIQNLKQQLEQAQEELSQAKSEIQNIKLKNKSEIDILTQRLKQITSQYTSSQNKMLKFQQQYKKLKQQIQILEAKLLDTQKDRNKIQKLLDEKTQQYKKAQQDISKINQQIEDKKKNEEDMKKDISDMQQTIQKTRDEIRRLESLNQVHKETINNFQQREEQFMTDFNLFSQEFQLSADSFNTVQSVYQQYISDNNLQISELKKQITEQERNIEQKNDQLLRNLNQIFEYEQSIKQLKQQGEQAQAIIKALKDQNKFLQTQIVAAREARKVDTALLRQTEDNLVEAQTRIQQYESDLNQLRLNEIQYKEMQQRYQGLQDKQTVFEQAQKEIQLKLEEEKLKVKNMEQLVKELKQQLSEHQRQMNMQQQSSQQQLANLLEQNNILTREQANYLRRIDDVQEEMALQRDTLYKLKYRQYVLNKVISNNIQTLIRTFTVESRDQVNDIAVIRQLIFGPDDEAEEDFFNNFDLNEQKQIFREVYNQVSDKIIEITDMIAGIREDNDSQVQDLQRQLDDVSILARYQQTRIQLYHDRQISFQELLIFIAQNPARYGEIWIRANIDPSTVLTFRLNVASLVSTDALRRELVRQASQLALTPQQMDYFKQSYGISLTDPQSELSRDTLQGLQQAINQRRLGDFRDQEIEDNIENYRLILKTFRGLGRKLANQKKVPIVQEERKRKFKTSKRIKVDFDVLNGIQFIEGFDFIDHLQSINDVEELQYDRDRPMKIPVLERVLLQYRVPSQVQAVFQMPPYDYRAGAAQDMYNQVFSIFMGVDNLDRNETGAIQMIQRHTQQVGQLLNSRLIDQDLNFGLLIQDYDKLVQAIVRSFAQLTKRFILQYFNNDEQHNIRYITDATRYKLQSASYMEAVQIHFSVQETSAFTGGQYDPKRPVREQKGGVYTDLENARRQIVMPNFQSKETYMESIYVDPEDRRVRINLLKDIFKVFFDSYIDTAEQFNGMFQQLDNIDQQMFFQNYYGVNNSLLIALLIDRNDFTHNITSQQFRQRHIFREHSQDFEHSEFIQNLLVYFRELYDEGIMHNYQGYRHDYTECYRLGEDLPAKVRSITPLSRHMICVIMSFVQLIIQMPFFSRDERDILQFIFFPQFRNRYYTNYINSEIMVQDEAEQKLICHLGPVVNFLNMFDSLMQLIGVDYNQKRDDFITTKFSTEYASDGDVIDQQYFIHNNTMIFNNLLSQQTTLKREGHDIKRYINDREISNQANILNKVIINHLFYRGSVGSVQDNTYLRGYSRDLLGFHAFFNRLNEKKHIRIGSRNILGKGFSQNMVLEMRINTITESFLDANDSYFEGEQRLQYRNRDQILIRSRRNRADTNNNYQTVFLLLTLNKDIDTYLEEQNITQMTQSSSEFETLCTSIISQIMIWALYGHYDHTYRIDLNQESLQQLFENVTLYRSLQHMLLNMNDFEPQFDSLNQQVLEEHPEQPNQFVFPNTDQLKYPQLFNTSTGFYLSDIPINQPYLLDQDQVDIATENFNQLQQFMISHVGIDRYMITSIPETKGITYDQQMEQRQQNKQNLIYAARMTQYFRYFRIDTKIDNLTRKTTDPVKGIRFFLKESWVDQFGEDYTLQTDYVHRQISLVVNQNCSINLFYSLMYYTIPHDYDDRPVFATHTFDLDYIHGKFIEMGIANKVHDSIQNLKVNPEILVQELMKMQKTLVTKYRGVYNEQWINIELFDGNQYLGNNKFCFATLAHNVKKLHQFQGFTMIIWRGHVELFSHYDNTQEFLRQMKTKILNDQDYVKPTNTQEPPPQTHEGRMKKFNSAYVGQKHILVSYDFETGVKGEMTPYMIVFHQSYYGLSQQKQDFIQNILKTVTSGNYKLYKDETFFYLTTADQQTPDPQGLCKCFLNMVEIISFNVSKDVKIQVIAHNGGKFDHIILLKWIFQKWGHKVKVLGSLTDIRMIKIEDTQICFVDSLQMTQLGSLNAACGKNGMNLNIEKIDLGEVNHLETWFEYAQSPHKDILLEYCIHDVYMLQVLVRKFNMMMLEMLLNIYQNRNNLNLYEGPLDSIYVLTQSLSGTAFEFFYNYLSSEPIHVIDNLNVYLAARSSQRGGRTSVIDYGERRDVHDIDIVSSYPHQMTTHRFTTKLSDQVRILPMGYYQTHILKYPGNINHFSLYGITYFDLGPYAHIGYLPVKCSKTGVLFYPRQWGDEEVIISNNEEYTGISDQEYVNRILSTPDEEKKIMWIWGFQIANMFTLFCREGQDQWMKLKMAMEIKPVSIGRPFACVQNMFEERKRLKMAKKHVEQLGRKLMMNGLSGQMGMRDFPQTMFFKKSLIINETQDNGLNQIEELMNISKKEIKQQILRQFINKMQNKNPNIRLGSTISKLSIDLVENTDMAKITLETKYSLPVNKKCRLCHLISQITARGRDQLTMAAMMLMNSKLLKPIYFDTDSIYGYNENIEILEQQMIDRIEPLTTPKDVMNDEVVTHKIIIGNDLGNFQIYDNPLKKPAKFMQAYGKKMYITKFSEEDDPEQKYMGIKMKGSRRNDTDKNKKVFEQFKQLGFGQKQQIQWKKTGLKIQQVEIIKKFKLGNYSEYVYEDGTTRPFLNQQEKNEFKFQF